MASGDDRWRRGPGYLSTRDDPWLTCRIWNCVSRQSQKLPGYWLIFPLGNGEVTRAGALSTLADPAISGPLRPLDLPTTDLRRDEWGFTGPAARGVVGAGLPMGGGGVAGSN